MKKSKLFIIEIFISVLIVIGICFLFINPYFILKNWFKSVLYINDENRTSVENLLQESEYYKPKQSFNEVNKVQFFLAFNDFEFTLYYKDGTEETVMDDDLYDLKRYIQKNGFSKSKAFFMLGVGDIVLCLILNEIRKSISNKIDLIDKQEERES